MKKYLIILIFILLEIIILCNINMENEIIEKQIIVDETNTIKSSIDIVKDSVVSIYGYTNTDNISSVGTGFVYKIDDNYAYIITANHVISDLRKINVKNSNDDITKADIVGSDLYNDIAVIKVDKNYALGQAKFSDSFNIEIGDTVFTIGTPVSELYHGTLSKGVISYKNRTVTTIINENKIMIDTIQINMSVNSGNSGGPLVNINGEVIGVINSKLSSAEGIGFVIPINNIKSIIESLETGASISRIESNLELIDLVNNYELYKNEIYLDSDYEYGVYVNEINDDSIFSSILKEKDTVLKINDKKVLNKVHFDYLINKYDNIILEVKRDGKSENIDFTL